MTIVKVACGGRENGIERKAGIVMLSRLSALALLFPLVAGSFVLAQDDDPILGTTVQLPTFNFTTVNTTVMIPDGGSATLGGIDRMAEGSVDRGTPLLGKIPYLNRLFKNRAIGKTVSSSRFRAHARIMILDELEKEVMDQASAARAARGDRRTFEEMVNDHQAHERARQQAWERRKFEYLSRNVDRQPPRSTFQLESRQQESESNGRA